MCLFLEAITIGEAKSADTRAVGSWTDARTDGRNFAKTIFQNPLQRTISVKKGVGENARASCLVRTESIPDVSDVSIRWGDSRKYHCWEFHNKKNALSGSSPFFASNYLSNPFFATHLRTCTCALSNLLSPLPNLAAAGSLCNSTKSRPWK